MQFNAKDGSKHPSQMKAYEASQKPAPDAMAAIPDQPKSIQDDPAAMQLVDQLSQMGYGPEDVEAAMGGAAPQAGMDTGKEATQAAPLQIPGM